MEYNIQFFLYLFSCSLLIYIYKKFVWKIFEKLYFTTILILSIFCWAIIGILRVLLYVILLSFEFSRKIKNKIILFFKCVKGRYFELKLTNQLINPKTDSKTTSKFTKFNDSKKYNQFNQYEGDSDDDQFLCKIKTKFFKKRIEEEYGKGNISYQEYCSLMSYLEYQAESKYNFYDSDDFLKENLTDMNTNYNEPNHQHNKNSGENKKTDISSYEVNDLPKKKKKKKKKKSNKSVGTVYSDNVDLITKTSLQTENHDLFTNQSNSIIHRGKENTFNLTESLHEIERFEKIVNYPSLPNSKAQTSLNNKKQHFDSIPNNLRLSNEIKTNASEVTGKKKKNKKKKKSSAVSVISEKVNSSNNLNNNLNKLQTDSYFNKSEDYDYENYITHDFPNQSSNEPEKKIKSNYNDFNLQNQYSRFDLEPRASNSYQSIISENDSPIEESNTVAIFSDEIRYRNYDTNISKSIVRRDDYSLREFTHDEEEFDLEETIKKVKLVTEVTASVTNDVAKKFSSTLCSVGKSLTPQIQKHGSEFLSKNFGFSEQEASEKVDGILNIVSQTVQSAGKFFEQKERPMSKVVEVLQAQSLPVENTENNLIKDAASIVGNLMAISRNLSDISVKGVVKHASKNENNSL